MIMQKYLYKYSTAILVGLATLGLSGCFDSDDDEEVNEPPVATDIALITQTETPITQSLPASDDNGDTLSFELVETASLGIVELDPTGNFTYTPNPEITGMDSFVFSVTDGKSPAVTATVAITIEVLEVSFREQSRLAFSQAPEAQAITLNGRNFIQDVTDQNEYQDLIDGN